MTHLQKKTTTPRSLQPVDSAHGALVDAVIDYAIYMLDLDGQITSWNRSAERIKGYPPQEIIGQSFNRFFTEQDRLAGAPQATLSTALSEGRHQTEGWRVRKDGSQFWALVVTDLVRDGKGRPVGLTTISRDISEQHHAAAALHESQRNFHLLVDGIRDHAIYMLDPSGRINNWNSGAQRIKGLSASAVIGSHFSRFFTPQDQSMDVPERSLQKALLHGRYEAEGWRMRACGERFWASMVIDVIRGEHGEHSGFVIVTRDISEHREAQIKLEQTRDQLFQSQKLQALGQLTGGVAHDFNNLLTIILGSADLLQRSNTDERSQTYLRNITQAAQRGSQITQQLLAFARQQPLQTTRVAPHQFLSAAQPLFEQSLNGTQRLLHKLDSQLHPIQTDPGQLELALLNLIINARDASSHNDCIEIHAHNCVLDGYIDGLHGEFVAICIRDSGCGMSEQIRRRIFDPFFTTKGFGKGTGLGMSQVHGFVTQSGGAVRVESELNQGTSVTLYLPASRAETEAKACAETPRKRILLVDDDVTLAEVTVQMIEAMGYEAVCVHDASDALQLIYLGERIDLLLSDVVMPGGTNGLELASKVRKLFPELPILLASGFSNRVTTSACAYPLLPKPFSYQGLEQALAQLLPPQSLDFRPTQV